MTLCRRFDDAPIVTRPASIMKTSAQKLNHWLKNTTAITRILALIGEKSPLEMIQNRRIDTKTRLCGKK